MSTPRTEGPSPSRICGSGRAVLLRRLSEDEKRLVAPAPRVPIVKGWPKDGVHAAWIGHSTVLLRVDGFTILTDPVFSNRIGIAIGPFVLGMKRLVDPAVSLQEIPVPDLILLSHAHMDHLDRPSLRKLENAGTTVITASGTSDLLRVKRYRGVHELRWDETLRVGPAHVRALEVKHWGARTRTDVHRGYNGYLIEAGRYRILFGGDSAYTPAFRKVHSIREPNLTPWRSHADPALYDQPGFTPTAIRSRLWRWRMTRAPNSCFRCIIGRSN